MPMSAMKARFQIAECSSLYQQGRTGWYACKAILTIMWCNQNEYNEQRGTTKDWLFPFVRLEAIVSGVSVIITKVATKRKMEKPPRKSISIPSKAQKWMMPMPGYWQFYKPQKRIKEGFWKMNQNEPIFLNLYIRDTEMSKTFVQSTT